MDRVRSIVVRAMFLLAFAVAGLAVFERLITFGGYTILRGSYSAGRLFEFAGLIVLLVISLLLREIKHLLASKS